MPVLVVIRGGGDLASGVALRLFRAGISVLVTELKQPLAVRRLVSFAEAIYQGWITIEGVTGRKAQGLDQAMSILSSGEIPVLADSNMEELAALAGQDRWSPVVLVDGRMIKKAPVREQLPADLVIGLGPGYTAGENCHAVIETNRGHYLGRVIWEGAPEGDTGIPDPVGGRRAQRVLRAPADGFLEPHAEIGDRLRKDQLVGMVTGKPVRAPFDGVLRGLIHPSVKLWKGLKIGDVDPRGDPKYCRMASDKSLAIGGGVLEAILSQERIRPHLWG